MREDHDLKKAEILEIKQTVYSRYERGLRTIPVDLLIRLSKFYQVSFDFLLGLTDNPTKNRLGQTLRRPSRKTTRATLFD